MKKLLGIMVLGYSPSSLVHSLVAYVKLREAVQNSWLQLSTPKSEAVYMKEWYLNQERKNIMSQRYSGKSRKDSSTMKKSKLSLLEKRKIKREKKKKR